MMTTVIKNRRGGVVGGNKRAVRGDEKGDGDEKVVTMLMVMIW